MLKESKSMREIHKIREDIYRQTRHMTFDKKLSLVRHEAAVARKRMNSLQKIKFLAQDDTLDEIHKMHKKTHQQDKDLLPETKKLEFIGVREKAANQYATKRKVVKLKRPGR